MGWHNARPPQPWATAHSAPHKCTSAQTLRKRSRNRLMGQSAPRKELTKLHARGWWRNPSTPPHPLAMCTMHHAPCTTHHIKAPISERTLKMYCYQFLDVVVSLASIYRNPFSWIEWHIEKQFSTERVHPFLFSCSYQLPLTPSLFYLFLCFSFI